VGYSNYSKDTASFISASYAGKTRDDVFVNNKTASVDNLMSPKNLKFRECRDSDTHPESLAIIIMLDVTGSMSNIVEDIVRRGLSVLMETLLKHGVKDPSVMFMAVSDHLANSGILQVGQFEAGAEELNKWLTSTWLEGGGGGQDKESYLLGWHVAAKCTSIDCFEKRNQKGFFISIGDEASWDNVPASIMESLFGGQQDDLNDKQALEETKSRYNVFHIHCNDADHRDDRNVIGYWEKMLGQHLIKLDNHNVVAEVIASTIAVQLGADLASLTKDFDKSTSASVTNALAHVGSAIQKNDKSAAGIATL
jgi:hypothetical protein